MKLENILTESFLEAFWFELNYLHKVISERDCQRVFIFCMRCFYPEFFNKMVSDIPGVTSSLGYDITIITPEKTFFIEMKMARKGKIEKSQESFRNEIKGYSFLEYHLIFVDLPNKKLIIQ